MRIGACLHVTTETANLMLALKAGGAEITLCASNPLSTQDDIAAALAAIYDIPTFAIKGEDEKTYYKHIEAVVAAKPHMTMDDGCDLVTTIYTKHNALLADMIGGCEETTTGVIRLKAMEKDGVLPYPVIAVNNALTKHMFDNRYGTGQSTHRRDHSRDERPHRGTHRRGRRLRLVRARRRFARQRAWALTSSSPKSIRARRSKRLMDGFQVMPMAEAAKLGDIFVTVTGNYHVIGEQHFEAMKDGAIVCNSGHFNDELDLDSLERIKVGKDKPRPFVDRYELKDGRKVCILGEGRLINLAAAEGHPAAVMDMSFANQAMAAAHLAQHHKSMEKKVYDVPDRHRRGSRQTQACVDARRYRHLDAGARALHVVVVGGHLTWHIADSLRPNR